MASEPTVKSPNPPSSSWSLRIAEPDWIRLRDHLFQDDRDEHAAVMLAGVAKEEDTDTLLVRSVILARDGEDYVAGERGYRALTPSFIAGAIRRARDEGFVYLAAHNHGGDNEVGFSTVDFSSHERGYPALTQITGRAVGGLVFARNAVAGDLWMPGNTRASLTHMTVVGRNMRILRPHPRSRVSAAAKFDRQARLFGDEGQRRLAELRVGIVGLGGAGSVAAEMLARLGVGELVLVDPDRIEESNLPRIIGSRRGDIHGKWRFLHPLRRRPRLKVDIASRAIRRIGLGTVGVPLAVGVAEPRAAEAISRCDWIVLAADSQEARHVVNAVVQAFLIPAVQVGVKIPTDAPTGEVGDVFAVSRRVLPGAGCLWCNGLVDPTELQLEVTGDEGRRARAYVGEDAPAPSVITLNGLAVSIALTDLMLSVTGLLNDLPDGATPATYTRVVVRSSRLFNDEPRRDPTCPYCGDEPDSLRARGSEATLPVRFAFGKRPMMPAPTST